MRKKIFIGTLTIIAVVFTFAALTFYSLGYRLILPKITFEPRQHYGVVYPDDNTEIYGITGDYMLPSLNSKPINIFGVSLDGDVKFNQKAKFLERPMLGHVKDGFAAATGDKIIVFNDAYKALHEVPLNRDDSYLHATSENGLYSLFYGKNKFYLASKNGINTLDISYSIEVPQDYLDRLSNLTVCNDGRFAWTMGTEINTNVYFSDGKRIISKTPVASLSPKANSETMWASCDASDTAGSRINLANDNIGVQSYKLINGGYVLEHEFKYINATKYIKVFRDAVYFYSRAGLVKVDANTGATQRWSPPQHLYQGGVLFSISFDTENMFLVQGAAANQTPDKSSVTIISLSNPSCYRGPIVLPEKGPFVTQSIVPKNWGKKLDCSHTSIPFQDKK